MVKRTVSAMLLSIMFLLFTSCMSDSVETLEQRARRDSRNFPDIVRTLPDGFIALDAAVEEKAEMLRTLFWSTNFVVQDSEGITIFQTDVKDRDFIVIYGNAFHVNESMFTEIAQYANCPHPLK